MWQIERCSIVVNEAEQLAISNDPADMVSIALALAIRFEGIYLKPYLDPAGIPTQGIGCTVHLDGRRVMLKDPPVTRDFAIYWCRTLILKRFWRATVQLCPGIDTAGRLAALIDFTFNLGEGRLRVSTLRRKVNAGQWDQVPAELLKWVRGNGRVLPGLVKRRQAEAALI